MRIVLAGATGFLGGLLRQRLGTTHELVILTRRPRGTGGVTEVAWHPDGTAGPWAHAIDGADAVVNLAGEPLVGQRWSPTRKAVLVASRIEPTRSLVAAIDRASARPRVLISASAVGYYGPHGDEALTEDTRAGHDFLASLCVEWENAALAAEALGTRVVTIRTGLVLSEKGGALKPMLLPFRLGLGGPIGSGSAVLAVDSRRRLVCPRRVPARSADGVRRSESDSAHSCDERGVREDPRHRAAPASDSPRAAVRASALLGEVADALLLSGQRAEPRRAIALGYRFAFRDLETALRQILRS